MALIEILYELSVSNEFTSLNARPISNTKLVEQQERIHLIYKHIEEHFKDPIEIGVIANKANLSIPAFCRYFKKMSKLTYTDFVNQYRINHAKKLLLQEYNISKACFNSGFENLSYFNRTFKKITGLNPSQFKKHKMGLK